MGFRWGRNRPKQNEDGQPPLSIQRWRDFEQQVPDAECEYPDTRMPIWLMWVGAYFLLLLIDPKHQRRAAIGLALIIASVFALAIARHW